MTAVALAVATKRRPNVAAALLAVAALAAGAALTGFAWRAASDRRNATFGTAGTLELSIEGTLLTAAERDRDGRRSFAIETRAGERPALRLRIDVADVPHDDAARIDALRRGDTVRAWCRLRAPAGGPGTTEETARRRMASQRLDGVARVKSSRLVTLAGTGRWSPGRVLDGARVRARVALDRAVGDTGDARAVLGAMLLGDRLLLDDDTNALLRDAGLIHILSISGLHTALTVLFILALLRRTGLGARGLLVTGGIALCALSMFVGHGAPVWRACASLGAGLLARVLSRDVDPMSCLALSAGMLVVAVPPLAWNVGFTLSVAATAGLLAACPRTAPGASPPSALGRSMAASTGAYLATAPLLAQTFGRLAPVALVANLAAAPLCAACLAAGAAAIAFVRTPLAGPVSAWAAKASVAALLSVSRWAVTIPGGHLRVAQPSPGWLAAYAALLLAAWLWNDAWGRNGRRAIGLLFWFCLVALHLGPIPPGPGAAGVAVLNVGQGLAVVLRGDVGRFVLVDAGPTAGGRFDAGDRIVVPALAARGCRRLEVLAISHDHDDHAGGARAVLRDLEVGELWVGEGSERDRETARVVEVAVARGVAVRRMKRGDGASRAGWAISVLHPGLTDRGRPLNDRCLVLGARTSAGSSILLPGDLETGGERAVLDAGVALQAGALVAPHHGADGSSTPAFLNDVAPRFVLVSAGASNRFGHPGAAALARFASVHARVLRTDRDGTLTLTEAGGSWRVSVETQRGGYEAEDEDDGEGERDGAAAGP